MGVEIERKFLVTGTEYRKMAQGVLYRQGYLSSRTDRVVRVRMAGSKGFLTIKGKTEGAVRAEFEYEIPVDEANAMISTLCEMPIIEKYRYTLVSNGNTWEVDEFLGDNLGLVVAEIELESEDQSFEKPPWVGEEVTCDPRYYNVNLFRDPYTSWKKEA